MDANHHLGTDQNGSASHAYTEGPKTWLDHVGKPHFTGAGRSRCFRVWTHCRPAWLGGDSAAFAAMEYTERQRPRRGLFGGWTRFFSAIFVVQRAKIAHLEQDFHAAIFQVGRYWRGMRPKRAVKTAPLPKRSGTEDRKAHKESASFALFAPFVFNMVLFLLPCIPCIPWFAPLR